MNNDYREFHKTVSEVTEISADPIKEKDGVGFVSLGETHNYEYAVLYYTDRVAVKKVEETKTEFHIEDVEKLTELRIFGLEREIYCIRAEDGWAGRIRTDSPDVKEDNANCEIFDELHKVWNKVWNDVEKPEKEEESLLFIRVRNYFNTKGSLKFIDSRFVGFEPKSPSECKEAGEQWEKRTKEM